MISDAQFAERIARTDAELAARGRSPFIESPVVYRLLDAILASHAERERKEQTAAVAD